MVSYSVEKVFHQRIGSDLHHFVCPWHHSQHLLPSVLTPTDLNCSSVSLVKIGRSISSCRNRLTYSCRLILVRMPASPPSGTQRFPTMRQSQTNSLMIRIRLNMSWAVDGIICGVNWATTLPAKLT